MKKKLLALILAFSLIFSSAAVFAESAETQEDPPAPAAALEEQASQAAPEAAPEETVVLQHTAVVQGKPLNYTTTTGYMTVETLGGACDMFYVAYTLDGVEDLSKRPVTFAYNGGPGAAAVVIQLGFLSPRRVDVDPDGKAESIPVSLVDNNYSILDLTDLVFIDPVGTGYSKPAEGADPNEFLGYGNDLRSVGDFIRQYINRNGRWFSPKYLAGESYGTTRSIGLTKYLSDTYAVSLNGIILISLISNFTAIMDQTNIPDIAYILYLPTCAAIAWYHKKLSDDYQQMELEEFLKEVRSFAGGEYLSALFKGRTLDDAEKADVAAKLAAYTGLTAEKFTESNLRIEYPDFCQSLLEDQKLVVGRYDGRVTGPFTAGDMENGAGDPSAASSDLTFGNVMNGYLSQELGFQTDHPYIQLSQGVNAAWTFPEDFGSGFNQADVLYDILSKNPFLKIWVLCGYYDLATPFYSAEWALNHVFVNDDRAANIQFSYYPSGHMIYMHEPSLAQFRKEAEKFFSPAGTLPAGE